MMPENNYNVTKKIPIGNGAIIEERDIKDVFPIRLWLAGLPQAEVAFSRETLNKMLKSLDPTRLAAYHSQKKLFSGAAVGAQLDRVELMRDLFEQEVKKDTITLTPKALFLKFVDNHPSYSFLKGLKLSDFNTFMLLGQVPEGADWSIIRHPLKTYSMWGRVIEMSINAQQGLAPFSRETFATSAAPHMIFFQTAAVQKLVEGENQAGLDIIEEVSTQLHS